MIDYLIPVLQNIADWMITWRGPLLVFFFMAVESSLFPFPSEVIMIPAGYLAYQGQMNLFVAILVGIGGSLAGALFNYWLAVRWGRPLFERYGRFVLLSPATLERSEEFFARHGHISTFIGRLLPGIRQYISLPAGLSRMNLAVFITFTTLGAGIWVVILALTGYLIGNNQDLITTYLQQITIAVGGLCFLLIVGYILYRKKRKIQQG